MKHLETCISALHQQLIVAAAHIKSCAPSNHYTCTSHTIKALIIVVYLQERSLQRVQALAVLRAAT
jgi:hypothetical protein